MGSTLTNGIYLPAEGERNCYEGLAANWVALDGMIGGYGAHAANTTIHVTAEDKTKWDAVDNKADASALTAHTGDTTIHVTAADKEAWNGKADASALTAHTGDTTIHVTAEDKTKWDAVTSKANDSGVVHKSGNETVGGAKTFSDNLTIYNSDDTQTPKGLTIRNAQWGMGESGGTTVSNINFVDKNSSITASIIASKGIYGQSFLRFGVRTKDSQNNTYAEEIYYYVDTSGSVSFRPWHDNIISLGTSVYKWKDVQTKLINGLTPSSLGMPDSSNSLDISGYITDMLGSVNYYTAPANGFVDISANGTGIQMYVTNGLGATVNRQTAGSIRCFVPVLKSQTVNILIWANTLGHARFIPCLGNA